MHKVVEKLISNATMIQNFISFISEIKSYASKPKVILTRFEERITSNPLYFWQVQLPCNNSNDATLLRKHFTLLKQFFLEV